jgi:hypothetical protein
VETEKYGAACNIISLLSVLKKEKWAKEKKTAMRNDWLMYAVSQGHDKGHSSEGRVVSQLVKKIPRLLCN